MTKGAYEDLDKDELIALVIDLNKQLSIHDTIRATAAEGARLLARLSLAVAIIFIPFRYRFLLLNRPIPPIFKDYTDFLLFASDIAVFCVIGFWLLSLALEPRKQSNKLSFRPLFLTIPLCGIVLFSGISAIFSIDPTLSIYHTLRLICLFGLYLYAVQDIGLIRWIMLPAGISISIQAVIGTLQVLGQSSLGLIGLGELELKPEWSGVSIVWAEGIRSLRAYGLSDHPNILGGCLAFSMLVVVLWYLKSMQNPRSLLEIPVIISVFFLGGAALFLTYSRSAWLALAAGILLILILLVQAGFYSSWRSMVGLVIGGLVITIPIILYNAPYLGVRLNYQAAHTVVGNEFRAINERRMLNASANDIFAQNAMTGVGLGAYPQALRLAQPDFPIDYQPAHIALVAAAADIGLFGSSAYAVALAAPWLALGAAWWKGNRDMLTLSLICLSGLLMALTVVGLFDYYTWLLAPGRLWQWLAWGLWGAAYQSALQGENRA